MSDAELLKAMSTADKNVVFTFASTGMNQRQTAIQLHYHYNTVRYHLNVIRAATGLNPLEFFDLARLATAVKREREGYDNWLTKGGD